MEYLINKYRAKKQRCWDGTVFDSKKELLRWETLLWMSKVGKIRNLRRQVSYDLVVCDIKICKYIADFVYEEKRDLRPEWSEIVEDVKSEITQKLPVYRLKKKLMKAIYNIEIRET